MPDELISGIELAKRLEVSRQTIQKAYKSGRIDRNDKRLYSWPQVKIDFEQSRTVVDNRTGASNSDHKKGLSLSAEQRLLVRARREKVETENKVLRGELIKKKEVQKAVLQITAQLKSEFQNFPIRLSPSLAAAIIGLGPTASANEIEATVRKVWENEAYKALEQILCGEVVP